MIATTPAQGNFLGTSVESTAAGSLSRQQPPSERDFELYLALIAEALSTRAAAARFGISQTRVLQVRDRVAQWLGAAPPPLGSLEPQRRVRLVGEAAMHRMEYLLSQMVEAWHASKGTTTKVRVGEGFNEVTTTCTTHGDIRYLIGASHLNSGALKLAEGLEAAVMRVEEASATHSLRTPQATPGTPQAAPGTPQRAFPTARDAATSPDGDCSRDEAAPAVVQLAPATQPDATGDEPEVCDEFAARRREFLAALDDDTTPVQPPRTDAGGMLLDEPDEEAAEEELSVLPLAAGAEAMSGVGGSAPSLTRRVSTGRPLSRKERRARKRLLAKLKRKAR
jgi:hypothetical protein